MTVPFSAIGIISAKLARRVDSLKTIVLVVVLSYVPSLASAPGQIPRNLTNYTPHKYVIGEKYRAVLDSLNWHDGEALNALSNEVLNGILRDNIENLRYREDPDGTFPIIAEKKIAVLEHNGNYSILLWLNDAATIFFGAVIDREGVQYSLYYFGRDMSLEDVDGNGHIEIVVRYPIIYKQGVFFGKDPMVSVWWYDIFVLDGTLQNANARFPEFYRKTLVEYKKIQESIRTFDFKGYVARNKSKYADPDGFAEMTLEDQSKDLQILSTAILAAEAILQGK